jgi:predicted ATPase
VEWAQRELMLRVGLSIPLQALRGYDDPEVGRLYGRARELCRQEGETPYLLPVLWHLSWYYNARAEHRLACEMAEYLLALAERAENSLAAAAAHLVIGHTFFLAGEWVESRTHLERAVTLCRALEQQQSTTFLYGLDIGEISMLGLCANLTILGYPDQGLEMGREALAYAEKLSYPLAMVAAYGYLAMHHMYRRDPQAAWEMGEACVRVSAEQGFAFWEVTGRLCCGWALVEQGLVEEGAALLRQYIAETQATGTKKGAMLPLAGLAKACGKMGQVEKGLGLLDEALTLALDSAEYFYEAEIHRLKGELFVMQGEEMEAESCFGHAIKVADQLDAKLWELRATVSLCRLWQQQGRRAEARERLARIYGWFTEGFDAPDLREAKALLEALSHR